MAKCTRASADEVLTRFQVGDKRFIEALGLRDGFVSVQGEVLVEMAEVIAAANAEIDRLRAEVQKFIDQYTESTSTAFWLGVNKLPPERQLLEQARKQAAAFDLLHEIIQQKDHPHAQ